MEKVNPKTAKRATYEDVLKAPAHMVAELIDGVLYTFPRPATPHSRASSGLGMRIGAPFDHGQGGTRWLVDS